MRPVRREVRQQLDDSWKIPYGHLNDEFWPAFRLSFWFWFFGVTVPLVPFIMLMWCVWTKK